MKKKSVYIIVVVLALLVSTHCVASGSIVWAKESNVEYSYDAAGRLVSVTYEDGSKITYSYDANGNVTSNQTQVNTANKEENTESDAETNTEKDIEQDTSQKENISETGKKQEDSDDKNDYQDTSKEVFIRGMGLLRIEKATRTFGNLYETTQDKKIYKKFQSKKLVVKSLKKIKDKNKLYLKIQIKKLKGLGNYQEIGYEIKYATNQKFNKAESTKVDKKGSVTGKKWKVKKGTTYWVKARAYMKTKKGKKIYSKYSKTVEIRTD